MSQVINLSEEHFFRYLYCPIQYSLFKNGILKQLPDNNNSALERIAKFFFTNLMIGSLVSAADLKKQWDIYCRKNIDRMTPKETIEGIARLMTLYKWAERIKLRILDMLVPYEISFSGREEQVIHLHGNIPVIAINQSLEPELLLLDFGDKQTNQARLDTNLKYTVYCYAYRQKTGHNLGIKAHNLKYDTDKFSYRHQGDYERLISTVVNVGFSVANKIIYPRESAMCISCPTLGACKLWKA